MLITQQASKQAISHLRKHLKNANHGNFFFSVLNRGLKANKHRKYIFLK